MSPKNYPGFAQIVATVMVVICAAAAARAQWQSVNIGTATAGATSEAGGVVTVRGSGEDIWGTSDEFHYRFQRWSGDGQIVARVTGIQNTNGWAKAGVMFREDLVGASRHAFMCVSAELGPAFQARTATGGNSATTAPPGFTALPQWIRLVRQGSTFSAYESTNGTIWTLVGTQSLVMADPVFVGLAVTSHVRGTLCTATFDNVTVSASGGPPPPGTTPIAPTNLAGTAPAHDRVTLTWSDNASNESGYEVQLAMQPTEFSTALNLAAGSTTATVTGLGQEITHYFRVRAFNAAGNSAFSNVVAVTTPREPGPPTLAAPTNLRVTATSSSTVALAWTDNASSEIGFEIGRSADGVNFEWSPRGTANLNTGEVNGLQPTTTYYFGVRAYQHSADGWYYLHSESSNIVTATTSAAPPPPVPPNAPSNLVATATSSSQINLTWTDNSNNEAGFEIVRSNDNVTFSSVASAGANLTSYADAGLAASTTYYYYLRALNTAGASGPTITANATTQASSAPPVTWQSADVGDVGATGSASESGTQVTLRGSGEDIWGTNDAFHFYSRSLTGDGEISVQLVALDNTDGWAKAGVMLRGSNDPGAPYVFIYATPSFSIAWQHRETTGGSPSFDGFYGWPTVSLRIVRTGNMFAVHYFDGSANWALARTFNFPMPATLRAGLAVTSHRRGTLASATFDRLTARQAGEGPSQPPPTAPLAPSALAATAGSAGGVRLTWVDNARDENAYEVHRATDAGSATLLATIGPSSVTYTDTAVQAGHSYAYAVRATNGAGASPFSNSASIGPTSAPSIWSTANIGNYGAGGSFTDSSATITVRGSGEDIWDRADGFFFVHQSRSGDVEITVRLDAMENSNTWAKAGLMIRESLQPGARHAFVCLTPEIGAFFQARLTSSDTTSLTQGPWWVSAPYWLRLTRRGTTFSAYTSADGATWTLLTTQTLDLPGSAFVGLAVSAHDVTKSNTAVFGNVQVGTPTN